MKVLQLLILFSMFAILLGARRPLVSSPARAIWIDEKKIQLTLPSGLNVNSNFQYFLQNRNLSAPIKLSVLNSHARSLDLEIGNYDQEDLLSIITGPLSLITTTADGDIVDETSIQLAGLLDRRFFYEGNDLGPVFTSSSIAVKLWAPTASGIQLLLFRNSSDQRPEATLKMEKEETGVWSTSLQPGYKNYFYLYQINIYSPVSKTMETNLVTDPYSKSLSINSKKSQLVDVNDSSLKPSGWDSFYKKASASKIIYETHLRDLTAGDNGVAESERGTYVALTRSTSEARAHLKTMASNGLTYIHLLPLNDFASVNEDRSTWSSIDLNQTVPGASEDPSKAINKIRNEDAYNWGYDPVHYMVPDGSYSRKPDGSERIKELRSLVYSFGQMKLKTIVDVVFNHTYSSSNDSFSVFNKIVPLYYYRLDSEGNIANSSCCSDTASENKMMEKLMIDTVVYWAKTYKVDGFRFDLMSFHTRSNLLKIKEALSKLTLSKDGVSGKDLYLYGEGWSFGSLVDKNPSQAFTQLNSYGAGIGFFNDRFRDAIRGGTTNSQEKSDQGFVTGLFFDFNQEIANRNTPTDLNDQKKKSNHLSDVVKIGLAGNLRDFQFKNSSGTTSIARDYYYRGVPTGYAATTDETVNYVSAHDGYSLWDAISAKAPFYTRGRNPGLATTEEKQRMQQMSLALTLLSQGVPFIEGGSEILRSKSGDVDSYDSGDWFNRLHFDYEDNNWGRGLPPSFKNYDDWSFWTPRLNDKKMKPSATDIQNNFKYFNALLKVRNNSSLFQLKTVSDVSRSLSFIDNQFQTTPGLIAMYLKNSAEEMIILFNVDSDAVELENPLFNRQWKLHPFLDQVVDSELTKVKMENGRITVPARSTVILTPAPGVWKK